MPDRDNWPLSFGGTPLLQLTERDHTLDRAIVNKLASLDVRDAEQLLGMVRDEETKRHLSEHLGISSGELERVINEIKAKLPEGR